MKRILSVRGMGQVLTVTAGLIILCIVFAVLNPVFFSLKNISNLLRQIAPILLIGIGQSYVLITGNIDLSIGSVVGMSTMISATLMTKGVDPWGAVILTLFCCLAVGLGNGLLGIPVQSSTLYRNPWNNDHRPGNRPDCQQQL